MTMSSLIVIVDSKYSHTLHYKNWVCASAEANAELQLLIENNKSLREDAKGYIGYVVPAFTANGDHILPSQLKTLAGAVVEVSAFVSHEVFGSGSNRTDNFFLDISYITILDDAPPPAVSPAKKRDS